MCSAVAMDLTSYLLGLFTIPGLILVLGLAYFFTELDLLRRERRLEPPGRIAEPSGS